MISTNNGKPAHGYTKNASQKLTPVSDYNRMGKCEHLVQLYEADSYLLDSLSGFISTGLAADEACIAIATGARLKSLEERLEACGLDMVGARARGRYLGVDAEETIPKIMVNGSPEPERFSEVIGGILARAAKNGRRVRVFGEMVGLLCLEGQHAAAIRLEDLWNDLHRKHPFSLLCAYPLKAFGAEPLADSLLEICSEHSQAIPAESYTTLTNKEDRLRAIILLQQKARLLEAEVEERREAERKLRAIKSELELQVEDLRRLHEMSVRLTSTFNIETVLSEVLNAALAVHGTDMGLLSLCEPSGDGLSLKVSSGFDEGFLKQVEWVPAGKGACGTCYEQRRRIVVEDVEADPIFDAYREAARAAEFRASHSTPLITRSGNIVGVLSVHFSQPHRPSEREAYLIDLYAQTAADIIENARLHHQVQQELQERERLLAREQVARAEAESANRLKDEFLATVSHELRTPLNAIIGWTHMLRTKKLNEDTSVKAVETIERNAKSQVQLVEDILDVSRVITGKLRLNIKVVDIASIIDAATDSVRLAADSKAISIHETLDASAPTILGDPDRLQQVIWNLLSNAIKFTPPGGRIEVRVERAGSNLEILVSDTGQGISSDFLPFIFDRFRQADGSSTRRHGGLGLGLAIVRHLVELHGGTTRVYSAGIGCGSTFTIKLPLSQAAH